MTTALERIAAEAEIIPAESSPEILLFLKYTSLDDHVGRYIVGYTFGDHVLRLRSRVAVKLNFRPYIRRYTSPSENFEYSYPLNVVMHQPTDESFRPGSSFTPICFPHIPSGTGY